MLEKTNHISMVSYFLSQQTRNKQIITNINIEEWDNPSDINNLGW